MVRTERLGVDGRKLRVVGWARKVRWMKTGSGVNGNEVGVGVV